MLEVFQCGLRWWTVQLTEWHYILKPSCGWKGPAVMFSLAFLYHFISWLISTCPKVVLWVFTSSCGVSLNHTSLCGFSCVYHCVSALSSNVARFKYTPHYQYMSKHCYRPSKSWQTAHSIFGPVLNARTHTFLAPSSLSLPFYLFQLVFPSFCV